jgi:hypothetical protein
VSMACIATQSGKWRQVGKVVLPAGALLCVALAGAVLLAPSLHGYEGWLMQAIASKSFKFAAIVLVASTLILGLLLAVLWRIGQAGRQVKRTGQEGVAILEFVLVLPVTLFIVMLMVQATMLMAGNLCVHYAAFCAARAAVTTIPLNLSGDPSGLCQNLDEVHKTGPGETWNVCGDLKLQRIREAALYALAPISCGDVAQTDKMIPLQTAVRDYYVANGEVVPAWVDGQLGRKWQYADDHTTVELVAGDNQTSMRDWTVNADMRVYETHEEVVVRVGHDFYLSVPLARRIFAMGGDGVEFSLSGCVGKAYATTIWATCRMNNEGSQDYVDAEVFPPLQ